MSNLQFASLRHEISHTVHESREPLSAKALMEMCKLATDERQISNFVYLMVKDGQLTKSPAPGGAGAGVRWLYGPGKVKLGAEQAGENAAGGGGPKAKAKGGRRKSKGKKAKAPRAGKKPMRKAPRETRERVEAMWALRADGAFILLAQEQGIVLPRPAMVLPRAEARALVEFVRTLDQGQA